MGFSELVSETKGYSIDAFVVGAHQPRRPRRTVTLQSPRRAPVAEGMVLGRLHICCYLLFPRS